MRPREGSHSDTGDSDDSGFIQSQDSFEEKEASEENLDHPPQQKRLLTDFRRFSTIGTPALEYGDIVNIPEVVVTSHDSHDEDSPQPPSHEDKKRRLRRSVSSPDGMLGAKMTIVPTPRETEKQDDFSVTLEDVQKYKFLRKTSRDSFSSNDDRYVVYNSLLFNTNLFSL